MPHPKKAGVCSEDCWNSPIHPEGPFYLPLHCLQLQKQLEEECHTFCDSMEMGASIII